MNVLCREDLSDRRLVALLEYSSDSLGNVIDSGELLRTFALTVLPSRSKVLRLQNKTRKTGT